MREWKNGGAWFLGDVINIRGENDCSYISSPLDINNMLCYRFGGLFHIKYRGRTLFAPYEIHDRYCSSVASAL